MKKALALSLIALLLAAGCSKKPEPLADIVKTEDFASPPPPPPINLTKIYRDSDQAEVDSLVQTDQTRFRKTLQDDLDLYIEFKAGNDTAAVDSLYPQLVWLCNEYGRASGVAEKTKRLKLYNSWTYEQAAARKRLEYALENATDVYNASRSKDIAIRYLNALTHLRVQYYVLADSFGLASIDYYRGNTFLESRQYDSAVTCLKQGIEICDAISDFETAVRCELLLIKAYNVYGGDFFQSEKEIVRAQQYAKRIGSEGSYAYVVMNRAFDLSKMFKTERSIELFQKASDVFARLGDQSAHLFCVYMLGENYYDLGNYDSARVFSDKAFSMRKAIFETTKSDSALADLAYSVSCQALIEQAEGNHAKATAMYAEAEQMFKDAHDSGGSNLNNLRFGSLLIEKSDYEQAERRFQTVANTASKYEEMLAAPFGLAVCRFASQEYDWAIDLSKVSISRVERSRDNLPDPEMRTGIFSDKLGFYLLPAAAFIRQYQETNKASYLDSAFKYIEQSKARALLDMLRTDDSEEESQLETALKGRISDQELALLVGADDPAIIKRTISHLEDSLLVARVSKPSESESVEQFKSSDLSTIGNTQRLLSRDDILLEYMISEFGSFVLTLTSDSVSISEMEIDRSHLNELLKDYLTVIGSYPKAGESDNNWRALSKELHDALIPKNLILSDGNRKRLIIVASDKLHYLPFETLIGANDSFLVELADVSYAPSATTMTLLAKQETKENPARTLIGFGNPDFGQSGIDSLPYSALELDSLAAIFGADQSVFFLKKEASEKNFRSSGFHTRYLHIATHGFTNDSRPGKSYLFFAGSSETESIGSLSSHEIAELDIPAELVFLSACQSGSGRSYPGEGVLSLAQPFLTAGAESVIVTYWNINDRFSVSFVSSFYRYLQSGKSKAGALALAKMNALKNSTKLFQHPYFWAPFVLIGLPD